MQKRDELSIEIQKELQNLDLMFNGFSTLREYPSPAWSIPSDYTYLIMEKETWDETPSNLFDAEIKKAQDEYGEVRKKFQGLFPNSAVLNKLQFCLHDLISEIYRELPCPPGIVRQEDKLTYFEKFIRDDFPRCKTEFEKWALIDSSFSKVTQANVPIFYV